MTIIANILAEGGDWPYLVMGGIFVIVSMIASAFKKKQEERAAEERRRRTKAPPEKPATPAQQQSLVSAALRSMGIQPPEPPAARAAPAATPKATGVVPERTSLDTLGNDVDEHVREHLQDSADALGSSVGLHVEEHIQGTTQQHAATSRSKSSAVRLTAARARQAMIYHEIFSPPKALRNGDEMWDRT